MTEPIDVARAIALFNRLRCWRLVALAMPRRDGVPFQPQAIAAAVGRSDKNQDHRTDTGTTVR